MLPPGGHAPSCLALRLGHPVKGEHPLQNPRSRPGLTLYCQWVRAFGGKHHLSDCHANGAEAGTRTRMGCPTRPSNVRVYQFHHFGMTGL